jgi:LmbE family N-acetylglucosaminyl deacetylase
MNTRPLPAAENVLVIQAHPDDEAFTTAGAMLALADNGATVRLLVATGGELGEQLGDSTMDLATARERRGERLTRSCRALGATWAPLTEPGRWIDGHPPTLADADPAEVAQVVRKAIDEHQPDLLLTVGPDGVTGHPDHRAMHAAVAAALALPGRPPQRALGAAIRAHDVAAAAARAPFPRGKETIAGVPDEAITTRVELSPALSHRRRQSLDAYHAGLGTDSLDALIDNGLRGGALALRAVFDSTDWRTEYYLDIA